MLISALNNPSIVLFSSRKGRRRGSSGTRGTKRYDLLTICCCTQLVGNLSKGLCERPTLTGSAHFTFRSSGFGQINEIVSTSVKKIVSNTHFIASRHIKLKGESLHFRLTGKLLWLAPQKIFRNFNKNHIFNTSHMVYLWKKVVIVAQWRGKMKERFSAIIIVTTLMMMMMMMMMMSDYDNDCGTVLCPGFAWFGFMKYCYSAYSWHGIFQDGESTFFPLMINLHTKKTRKGSSFGWLIRQMSINQKSGRKTFRRRFVTGSIFVSPCPPECYFQSETEIEPDLRLIYPQNLLVYFIWHCRVCRFLTASFPGSSLFLLSILPRPLLRCCPM